MTEASIEIFDIQPRKSQVYMLKSKHVTLKCFKVLENDVVYFVLNK